MAAKALHGAPRRLQGAFSDFNKIRKLFWICFATTTEQTNEHVPGRGPGNLMHEQRPTTPPAPKQVGVNTCANTTIELSAVAGLGGALWIIYM